MTFLRFKLTCSCEGIHSLDANEMVLVDDDMCWVFECTKCGRQVNVENWTSDTADSKGCAQRNDGDRQ
jgi:hypothetical protein